MKKTHKNMIRFIKSKVSTSDVCDYLTEKTGLTYRQRNNLNWLIDNWIIKQTLKGFKNAQLLGHQTPTIIDNNFYIDWVMYETMFEELVLGIRIADKINKGSTLKNLLYRIDGAVHGMQQDKLFVEVSADITKLKPNLESF